MLKNFTGLQLTATSLCIYKQEVSAHAIAFVFNITQYGANATVSHISEAAQPAFAVIKDLNFPT